MVRKSAFSLFGLADVLKLVAENFGWQQNMDRWQGWCTRKSFWSIKENPNGDAHKESKSICTLIIFFRIDKEIFRPTISSSVLKSRAHRERSQTANMHKVGSRNRLTKSGDAEGNQNECESRKISANSSNKEADSKQFHSSTDNENRLNIFKIDWQFFFSQLDARPHSGRVDSINCLQSIPERCLLSETNLNLSDANSSKKNSIVGMLASRIGAKMSAGSTGKQTAEVKDQLTAPCSPSAQSVGKSFVLEAKNTRKIP